MSTIFESFKKRKALITFITAGDPSLAVTEKLIYQLEASGADIIELGIPFSDPLADGPVIQASHQRALKKGTCLADVFKLVGRVRKKTPIPICFMLSYNLIFQYGEEKYYADCARFGVNGSIVPDLPPEELPDSSSQLRRACRQAGIKSQSSNFNILLVAPNTSDDRMKLIASKASGFIYLLSVAGITGKRKELSADLVEIVAKIRKYTRLPIAIGFGISGPKQAAEAAKIADGVIVGSAIVDLIARKQFKKVGDFVATLRKALDR